MFKHKQLVFPVPCFLCSHYLAKLGPIEKEAAVFGEQLSSSHWARELSSLLSTSVAAWLKTQRDASIFFSTNTFSPKPRNNSAVNGQLTSRTSGLFIPLLLPYDPKMCYFQIPTMCHNLAHVVSFNLHKKVFTIGMEKWHP